MVGSEKSVKEDIVGERAIPTGVQNARDYCGGGGGR